MWVLHTSKNEIILKNNPVKMKLFQDVFMDMHSCHVVVQSLILNSGLEPTSCYRRDNCWCKSNLRGKTIMSGCKNKSSNINRGSYMSAHVLLNLLNELRKIDKMRGWSILSLFCNEFNKFNKTRAQMLDSIYHMILR